MINVALWFFRIPLLMVILTVGLVLQYQQALDISVADTKFVTLLLDFNHKDALLEQHWEDLQGENFGFKLNRGDKEYIHNEDFYYTRISLKGQYKIYEGSVGQTTYSVVMVE